MPPSAPPYVPPTYAPQAYAPPPQMAVSSPAKSVPTTVALGNVSLFAMAASLIFFGAFTFLGGFLLGMWFEVPPTIRYVNNNGGVAAPGMVAPEGMVPSPQQPLSPMQESSRNQQRPVDPDVARGLGSSASSVVGSLSSRVPGFFAPLASVAQDVVGRGVEQRAQTFSPGAQGGSPSSSNAPSSYPTSSQPGEQSSFPPPSAQTSAGNDSSSLSLSDEADGSYTVQLGVYAAPENADHLKSQLQALNHVATVAEGRDQEGQTVYSVQSGRYRDYATALEAVAQLSSERIPGAIVVKLPQTRKDTL